ncbi:MAG: cyclic nucleotide-binding domain-containing protein [Candidatus Cloacimonetes bacterium]|nr:cyclic nucleotide-binding domain-containing protein [Candidatus Cloacimonadota bacterium]
MSNQTIALNKFKILEGFNDAQIESFAKKLTPATIEAGVDLFEEGSTGENLYFLTKGSVKISQKLPLLSEKMATEIRDKTLIILQEGHYPCFGENGLLSSGKRKATVTAMEDSTFLKFSKQCLSDMIEEDPQMGVIFLYNLAEIIAERLVKTNSDVLKLTTALSIALS